MKKSLISFWDLLVKSIMWNIWIKRNARIFNFNCLPTVSNIMKIEHMLLSWLNAAPDSKKTKVEEPTMKIKRSLEFLSSRGLALMLNASPVGPPSTGVS